MGEASTYDVIVIGGGAAGLIAAGRAAETGKRVLLLEKNRAFGKKLAITGGGRCNIFNAEEDVRALLRNYGDSEQFLYSPFSRFGMQEARNFFEARGMPVIVEARKRAFPLSQRAADVVALLTQYASASGAEMRKGASAEKLLADGGKITGIIVGDTEYRARSFILATGGLSHPETGSTGDGFKWLRELGHTVNDPTPTIVPLRVPTEWVKKLAGKKFTDAKITFFCSGKRTLSLRGDILLTHFGLSGPLILNAAGDVADMLHVGDVAATIDAYPDLEIGHLDKRVTEVFDANKNRLLKNVFRQLAPHGMSDAILSLTALDPEKKVHSVTKLERRALVDVLKALPVEIEGLMGYERAVVADGGVPLTEIDTKTMRSLKCENLFLTGDLLHIRRPSGGYSLQLCWTTGYIAGESA